MDIFRWGALGIGAYLLYDIVPAAYYMLTEPKWKVAASLWMASVDTGKGTEELLQNFMIVGAIAVAACAYGLAGFMKKA